MYKRCEHYNSDIFNRKRDKEGLGKESETHFVVSLSLNYHRQTVKLFVDRYWNEEGLKCNRTKRNVFEYSEPRKYLSIFN